MSDFRAGEALLNKTAWSRDLELLDQNGITPKLFAKKAMERGSVCYFDSYYYAKNKKPQFNKTQFDSMEELVETYRNMPESQINYNGLTKGVFRVDKVLCCKHTNTKNKNLCIF